MEYIGFGSRKRQRIKVVVLDIEISQEVLADAANINRSYLSEIEQGIVSPTIVVVLRLARAFDVPASALVDDFTTATLARLKL